MNCNQNTDIPELPSEECGGVYTSSKCITNPLALPYYNLPINSSLFAIINAQILVNQYKDELIADLTARIEALENPV